MLTESVQSSGSLTLRYWVEFLGKELRDVLLLAGVPHCLSWGFTFHLFSIKKKISSLDLFYLAKTGTNADLSQKWSGVKRTFEKRGVPIML